MVGHPCVQNSIDLLCSLELPPSVSLHDAEEVADDLLLPAQELEALACPDPLGVAEALDEIDGVVCLGLVVGRALGHEWRWCMFLRLSHGLLWFSRQEKRTRSGP